MADIIKALVDVPGVLSIEHARHQGEFSGFDRIIIRTVRGTIEAWAEPSDRRELGLSGPPRNGGKE